MNDVLYGELVVFMFVALSEHRAKRVTLARIPCTFERAPDELQAFRTLNERVLRHVNIEGSWTVTQHL